MIDSHCHLDYFDDLDSIIERAKEQKIQKIVTIGTQIDDFSRLSSICVRYPDYVNMTIGVHPDNVFGIETYALDNTFKNMKEDYVIGVGEIGLDYHENPDSCVKNYQKKIFEYQLYLAEHYNKPVCIHTRSAIHDTLDIIKNFPMNCGVFHCFCENVEVAKQVLDYGYLISLSGIVTFKNAQLVHDVAKFIPLDRLLIETDAPYLAPVPYRGKRNEPSYVRWTGEAIAYLKGISPRRVFKQTTENFNILFF